MRNRHRHAIEQASCRWRGRRRGAVKFDLCAGEYPIEGPIQFDAAVDADVAAIKYKGSDSEVAGHATVCVFPDLNSGSRAAWKCVAPRRLR